MSRLPGIVVRADARSGQDAAVAALLTVAGLLEVLAGPAGDGSPAVTAVALAGTTVPLAWRRAVPLLPIGAIAVALIAQALLGGSLVGESMTPLVALVIALYSAGRHLVTMRELAAAVLGLAAVGTTRVLVDPAVSTPGQVVLTFVAASLPLLVGRWVRGQRLLQGALAEQARRLARDRERDARQAAEEERMRIAGDLQAAIAGGLHEIAVHAEEVRSRLRARDYDAARSLLAGIAATARDALADVRRVLGILRRDGEPQRLTPPRADPLRHGPPAPPMAEPLGDGAAPQPDDARGERLAAGPLDRLLAGALFGGVGLGLVLAAPPGERWIAGLTAAPIVAPLLWRRRHPIGAFGAMLCAIALQSLLLDLDAFPVADIAAVVCATYAVGAHADRRAALAGLALALLGAGVHAAVFYPDGVVAALLGGVAGPWTVGRVIRGNRLLTHQSRAEAARAELARARDARAAVTAERMRVARELHDAVAHNISVIAIQAGGADGIVERDAERAARVAALIETIAHEALAELGRLVGALDAGDGQPGLPQPSLAHVDALTARARNAGQPVELHVEGQPVALPTGVDLAAYRIVQEGLANAFKHAAGARARVVVRYERQAVELEIADDGRATQRPSEDQGGAGHGLIGIRERVGLYGGTLEAGRRPSGGFRVHARLPIGAGE